MIRYKTKLLPLLISALFVSIPSVEAAQLGKITVVSKPDQNFAAQILVERVLPGERDSMKVALASPEAFAAARLTLDPNLSKLRFSIKDGVAPGTAIIDVISAAPIPAGFIDTLLELSWAGGKVTREYTLSIPIRTTTPAVTPVLPEVSQPKASAPSVAPSTSPSASSTAPVPVTKNVPASAAAPSAAPVPSLAPSLAPTSAPTQAPVTAAPAKPKPSSPPSPASAAEPPPAKVAPVIEKTLKIKRGNTLSELALEYVGEGVTLNQAMAALFEANPEAFINGSIHLLKPGAELRIPNRSSIRSHSKNDALVILAGGDDRNDFSRAAKQLGLLTVAKQEDAAGKPQNGGQIEKGPAKQAASTVEQDRLKIAPGLADGNAKAKLDRAAEELIAKEKSLAEANERIALLERNVSDLQRLLELQNKASGGTSSKQADPAAPNAGSTSQQDAPTGAESSKDSVLTPPAEPNAENKGDQQVTSLAEAQSEAPPAVPPVAIEKTPEPSTKPDASEPADGSLMSNPWVLGGGVGVSLAFLAGLLVLLKKRKKVVEPQQEDSDEQNAESFNEALAWATGTGATNGSTDSDVSPSPQSAARVEDEVFDLDEVLSEVATSGNETAPEQVKPVVAEVSEPVADNEPVAESPAVDLNFESSEGDTKADVSSIFEDLDDLQKGAEAAKKEIDALRESTAAKSQALESELDIDVEDVRADETPSAKPAISAGDLDDMFDQAAAGLDLDLPDVELDAATRQEVDTKLDLAGAYVEIGDSEGASELLKEIIQKGDAAQVKKAKELLAGLK